MPAKWLFKSDPEHYSFDDLERDHQTVWDGISNNLALKHLRSARHGDLVLIYHTGGERAVVGVAEVLSDPYSDPKQNDPKLAVVDIRVKERLRWPVTLDEIRKRPALKSFDLVRLPRLSVMPVTQEQWKEILSMGQKGKDK